MSSPFSSPFQSTSVLSILSPLLPLLALVLAVIHWMHPCRIFRRVCCWVPLQCLRKNDRPLIDPLVGPTRYVIPVFILWCYVPLWTVSRLKCHWYLSSEKFAHPHTQVLESGHAASTEKPSSPPIFIPTLAVAPQTNSQNEEFHLKPIQAESFTLAGRRTSSLLAGWEQDQVSPFSKDLLTASTVATKGPAKGNERLLRASAVEGADLRYDRPGFRFHTKKAR